MIGNRRFWLALTGAVVILAAGVVALVWASRPQLLPVTPGPEVTIAGRLTTEQAGNTVFAHVVVSADRPVVLGELTVRVRDAAGTSFDFPSLTAVELGTTPRELVLNREFSGPGKYSCYLAYRSAGDWVTLPPWQDLVIR